MTASGLSQAGLAHLHDVMSAHVEAGEMPSLVTLVARGDDGTGCFGHLVPDAGDVAERLGDDQPRVV